jgi:hypothetical protein
MTVWALFIAATIAAIEVSRRHRMPVVRRERNNGWSGRAARGEPETCEHGERGEDAAGRASLPIGHDGSHLARHGSASS